MRWLPVLVLLAGACSADQPPANSIATNALPQPAGATWTAETAWRVSAEPIVQIKGSEEQVEEAALDPVTAFALDDGRIVVADGNQNGWNALLVFNQHGKHRETWGREGAGPGEFRQLLNWAGKYRADSVAAYDFVDRALEIFSLNGEFGRALKLPLTQPTARAPRGTYYASEYFIGAFSDGSVLSFEMSSLDIASGTGPAYHRPELVVYDANGQNPQPLGRFPTFGRWWNGRKAVDYPFHPMGITAIGKEYWYHGFADDFKVHVLDRSGREVRVLTRPFTREPVTQQDREAHVQWRVSRAKTSREGGTALAARVETLLREEAHFAEHKPAFSRIVEDDVGNVWVEHFHGMNSNEPARGPARWSVFDAGGRFLGELQTPASFLVSSISNDQLIGFYIDEFDVQHVRVYSLLKK
jgi:hypothetical protein